MNLRDFKRVTALFGIDNLSAIPLYGGLGKATIYSCRFGGSKIIFLDQGKNNDYVLVDNIDNFRGVSSDNIYGIDVRSDDSLKVSTREGFIMVLRAIAIENSIDIKNIDDINNTIVREILMEVNSFLSDDMMVFGDLNLAVKAFDESINPFRGKNIDDINIPANLSITGGKNGNDCRLNISVLGTNNSLLYTKSNSGVCYRLNCYNEYGVRLEVIHNCSEVNEFVITRIWVDKVQIMDWQYNMNTGILNKSGISDAPITEQEMNIICTILNKDATNFASLIANANLFTGKGKL